LSLITETYLEGLDAYSGASGARRGALLGGTKRAHLGEARGGCGRYAQRSGHRQAAAGEGRGSHARRGSTGGVLLAMDPESSVEVVLRYEFRFLIVYWTNVGLINLGI
jgi:hypothetical protein